MRRKGRWCEEEGEGGVRRKGRWCEEEGEVV